MLSSSYEIGLLVSGAVEATPSVWAFLGYEKDMTGAVDMNGRFVIKLFCMGAKTGVDRMRSGASMYKRGGGLWTDCAGCALNGALSCAVKSALSGRTGTTPFWAVF